MPGLQNVEQSTDLTVVQASQRAQIEAYAGISLRDADPEAIRFIVEASKKSGNEAFKSKRYQEAVKMYSQAIAGDEHDHTLFANRSAAYLALDLYDYALWDSQKAVSLSPTWPKGYYRLGCAHESLHQWQHARKAFEKGLQLEPSNKELQQRLARIQQKIDEELRSRNIAAATERKSLILKLRKARREDQKLAMLNQFKQSMTAPDWELEDLEWRPSWSPALRTRPLDAIAIKTNPKSSALLSFLDSLSDLSFPKAALKIIGDQSRMHGYALAISGQQHHHDDIITNNNATTTNTTTSPVHGKRVLCLSAGGGVLPIMCAQSGACHVTAIERSRMLYRMAKQVLESNTAIIDQSSPSGSIIDSYYTNVVQLVPQSIYSFKPPPHINTTINTTTTSTSTTPTINAPHDILITDLFDHGILGMGILPALDHAATTLLSSPCTIYPSTIYIYACLVQVSLDTSIQGFDLSPLDKYRWYPGSEKINLDSLPHKKLSKPFLACTLDLQDRINKKVSSSSISSSTASSISLLNREEAHQQQQQPSVWESDEDIDVMITESGVWNGVVFWFELKMPQNNNNNNNNNNTTSNNSNSDASENNNNQELRLASYIHTDNTTTSTSTATTVHRLYCPSWGQAIQYIDAIQVTPGSTTILRVCQDLGQICFITTPPSCRLRHALTPRWHYDMVQDEMRNAAYNDTLQKVISKMKSSRLTDDEDECVASSIVNNNNNDDDDNKLIALDMGAGTGLLSMMAARAGADEVYAAEMSAHMCDVAEETTIMNGFLGKVYVLDRDVRRMDVVAKADGTAPELPRRVDLAVFEVFDSGLIGEGVLHILAAAKAKLLKENAVLVPSSAVVYAQPIEMRLNTVAGIDVSQANRWRWRSDYEGIELNTCRNEWKPLAEPLPVFTFDFYDVQSCGRPSEQLLSFNITSDGVFNGVAMWFDLHLDEETTLSTSPYAEKGPTWQQAVQWMQEVCVVPGDALTVTARHDSYSISYQVQEEHNPGLNEKSTGVPMVDAVWKNAHDALHRVNAELAKACVQNPLEYRSIAQTSVKFASRPHDVGLDAGQAAEFCMKMMG